MSDTPVSAAIEAVRAARGEEADAKWAEAVSFDLVMNDVRESFIAKALGEAADQIARADEPAHDLFGDASSWASARRAEWIEEGDDWTDVDEPASFKGTLFTVLFAAAGISLLFAVQTAIAASWSEDISLAGAIFPTLLGGAAVGTYALFTALRERRSQVAAVAGTTALLIAVAGTLATVAWLANDLSLGLANGWWYLATTVTLAALAFAALQFIPAPRGGTNRTPRAPLDDDTWLRELGAALRTRGDITDHRANEIVTEAREHATDSGTTLGDEFGTPRAYAARFAKNAVVPARRRALFSATPAAVVLGILAIDLFGGGGFSYWTLAWFAVIALNAAVALAAWRSAVRGRA
ncbi:hypothetical protein GCM10010910_00350 [Microbacterium nanhaiense]|uniref:Uncharacterized protein n=1 Tax=Microbacterium nanhaiense TaxID=1301026 RepID=A0ABQ2MUG6_9MICO|nr:hypothetical protein [Microbacterium nanhaiense]GGO58837.1 hypothetical protein GCM10010910_00350 [Microbacterium nanhaiense]